jgi:DNA recombination protein RmuC
VALLRTVALYWQQERVAKSAQEAVDAARELFDRAVTFADHLAALGRGLDTAVTAYNKAVGSYESRLAPAGRRLMDLKVMDPVKEGKTPKALDTRPRDLG